MVTVDRWAISATNIHSSLTVLQMRNKVKKAKATSAETNTTFVYSNIHMSRTNSRIVGGGDIMYFRHNDGMCTA